MKRKNILVTLLFSLVGLSAFGEPYIVEVGQFEKLKVNGNFRVVYKNMSDSTGLARFDAPEDSEDIYKFITKGDGSLKIEPSDDKWGQKGLPVVYVYSDFLSSIESYSDQTVDVLNLAPCASFNASLVGNGTINVDNIKCNNVTASITTGNGTIYLAGKCINANYRMVGAGLISADQLSAENIKCRILGTGSIGCWPIDNLNVTGLGSTKIYYKGRPNIKKTGGGKLFELPDDFDEETLAKTSVRIENIATPVGIDDDDDDDDEEEESHGEYNEEDDDYQTVVTSDD